MKNTFVEWFERFLEEKDLGYRRFEIEHQENIHYIDSDKVIELIKSASEKEQKTIKDTLVKLDFYNKDIFDYFKHLATAYIMTNF